MSRRGRLWNSWLGQATCVLHPPALMSRTDPGKRGRPIRRRKLIRSCFLTRKKGPFVLISYSFNFAASRLADARRKKTGTVSFIKGGMA